MNYNEQAKKNEKKEPTQTQNKIITCYNYPKYLLAGAGTGKTEVLIQKIMHILKEDESVNLTNFAIITFTNKATDEMKERLLDRLYFEWLKHKKRTVNEKKIKTEEYIRKQVELANMIDVSTIHSFCEKIIRTYGLNIGISLNFQIRSVKNELNKIIADCINPYVDNQIFNQVSQYRVAKLLELFYQDNVNKGNVINIEDIHNFNFRIADNEYWNEFKQLFITMYLEVVYKINKYKLDNNILTTDDLIKKAAELVKDPYVAKKISAQYRYLFIDEFQDTNRDQFNLVEYLKKAEVKIFLVGDVKQSIYRFRGADVQNSEDMQKSIKDMQKNMGNNNSNDEIIISENFRTDYLLLEKINEVFEHKFTYEGQELEFPNMKLDKPDNLKDLKGSDDNPLGIVFEKNMVELINYLIKNKKIRGYDGVLREVIYEDIAILCRSNYDLDLLALELKNANINVQVAGGKGFYKSKEIIDTYKIFNSIINQSPIYRTELMFTDYYKAIVGSTENLNFDRYLDELSTMFREETVDSILDNIYTKSNIKEYYKTMNKFQEIANLEKLKDKARDMMSQEFLQPIQFLDYLDIMISSEKEEDDAIIANSDSGEGAVSIFSIHRAKGLSFPIVIIPRLDKKINRPIINPKIIYHDSANGKKLAIDYSHFNDEIDEIDHEYLHLLNTSIKKHMEEEIRILYVGLTRPEQMLILSCDKPKNEIMGFGNFVSWAKWINEIDGGKFLDKHVWDI